MQPNDFVFDQTYKLALKNGASEKAARYRAQLCIDEYKKNKMRAGKKNMSTGDLILKHAKEAAKDKVK